MPGNSCKGRLRTRHVGSRITQDRSNNINTRVKPQKPVKRKIKAIERKIACVRSIQGKKKAVNPIEERQLVLFGP